MNENVHRITKVTAVFMVAVALCFDLLQLGTGIIPLAGTLAAGAIGWIPLLGQLFGSFIVTGSILLQSVFGWIIMVFGYLIMALWFLVRGVPIIGATRPAQKIVVLFSALLVDLLPLLNLLPGITVWVIVIVYSTIHEDKDSAEKSKVGYNGRNVTRLRRRYVHRQTLVQRDAWQDVA